MLCTRKLHFAVRKDPNVWAEPATGATRRVGSGRALGNYQCPLHLSQLQSCGAKSAERLRAGVILSLLIGPVLNLLAPTDHQTKLVDGLAGHHPGCAHFDHFSRAALIVHGDSPGRTPVLLRPFTRHGSSPEYGSEAAVTSALQWSGLTMVGSKRVAGWSFERPL